MKTYLVSLFLAASFVAPAFAQTADELPKVKGLVRSVDKANFKLKLKHDEIPNLNMPAMTMTFSVADESMVDNLAPNDKVLFTADEINGELSVMWIEKQ